MSLLKQICEDISSYHKFVETILEKIEQFEEEISLEKRLGLTEADYYQNDNQPAKPNDTIDFKAPTEPVAKPVQNPAQARPSAQRIHLVYDPRGGRVVDVIKTDMRARPPAQYTEATAEQVAGALKHMENLSPDVAQRIKNGTVSIWIPRTAASQGASDVLSTTASNTGGITKVNMDPSRLAAAQAAANKMTVA